MNKKLVLAFVLVYLTSLTLVQSAESQSTGAIFIKADGTVSGTDKIQRNGNLYSLTDDIYNSPITVECNHIILDGKGFTHQGGSTSWVGGTVAINLTCSDVTVKNFRIVGFWEVGVLGAWNGNTVTNCNITGTDRAVSIYADDYVVTGNYLADKNHVGVRVRGTNSTLAKNTIIDNFIGIDITNTTGSLITANQFENNMIAVSTDYGGFQLFHNNFINQTVGSGGAWSATVLHTSYFSQAANITLPLWDNGFPSGGNYWSDYATRYPNASEIGSSGIGDTQYIIGIACAVNSSTVNTYIVEAVDRYPLLTPVNIAEATIITSSHRPSDTLLQSPSPPSTQPTSAASVPTQSPTPSPTHTASTQQTQPADSTPATVPIDLSYAVAIAAVLLIAIAAITVLLRKRKQ